MSIIVSGIRLPLEADEREASVQALKICRFSQKDYTTSVYRVSIDARRGQISRVYSIQIDGAANEEAVVERLGLQNVRCRSVRPFAPVPGQKKLTARPVVVGLGPAGLFAAYALARYGYAPIVLERGSAIDERDHAVNQFWEKGIFDAQSNIQFGEGGAGAYSDGKLTTRINDPLCDEILRIFVKHGAPEEIQRLAKPHIGTDILKTVVKNMRQEICARGGRVEFNTRVVGVRHTNGKITAITTDRGEISCDQVVLALGHSARDTYVSLHADGVYVEPKPFSVGVRIEHLQEDVDRMLYGKAAGAPGLPPAEYVLSHRENGRACYSFCMCPGGLVVAAQSEENTVVTNGMSYHARDGRNANAALAVSVDPSDYDDGTPFGGIAFQRRIEHAAYQQSGGYCAPCQRVGDFMQDKKSTVHGRVLPSYPIGVQYGSVADCLPQFVTNQLKLGLHRFGRKMRGFDDADALLTAPETRTSAPVRMTRGSDLYAIGLEGLIPCGEGAGYAGGIMSAAVDGLRSACRIIEQFSPIEG